MVACISLQGKTRKENRFCPASSYRTTHNNRTIRSFMIKRTGIKRRKPTRSPKLARKPLSISKLIKECDRLFSIKVRANKGKVKLEDMEGNEVNQCYTCLGIFLIKRLHAGHYLSRWYKSARWDFDNARPQCFACNIMRKGDSIKFRQHLVQEIGEKRVKAVEAKRNEHTKLTREYLTDLIEKLK